MTKRFVAMLLLLSCSGCAFFCKEIDNSPPCSPHHFCSNQLEMKWQAEQTDGSASISGTLRNLRAYHLQNLKLTARLLSEKGKDIATETSLTLPASLAPRKPVPFRLDFRLPPGTRAAGVRFSYVYSVTQGGPATRGYEDLPFRVDTSSRRCGSGTPFSCRPSF